MKQMTLTVAFSVFALFLAGCEVTSTDVDAAREDAREEQLETQQARAEGTSEIREKAASEQQLRETSMRQPNDEQAKKDLIEARKATDMARLEKNENVSEEQLETSEARKKADRLATELQATRARDAYLNQSNTELEKIDARIETMRDRLDTLEGVEKDNLSADIEVVKIRREAYSDAIYALKNEDVIEWESKKPAVDDALKQAQKSD